MKIISIRRLFERIASPLLSLFPFHFVSLFHTVSLLVCFDVPVAWLMFGTRELNIPRRSIPHFRAKYRLWISEIVIKNVSLSIDRLVKWSMLNHTKIIVLCLCSRGDRYLLLPFSFGLVRFGSDPLWTDSCNLFLLFNSLAI